ncbi:Glycerate dehydrogenase [compost metagenome]
MNAHSVAELTLLMILALRKRLGRLNAALKEGNWNAKYEVKGHNLYKSSLGIIGYGNIGRKLSLIANVIGMKILIYDHHPFDSIKQEHASRAKGTFVSLEELLMNSDTVSLHVPLTDGTRYMIDCPQFNLCRPNCILINTARADLVNPTALQEALLEKKIAGLGIDVHYHEPIHRIDALINMDNVLATPHVGSQTVENIELIGERIIDIITMLNNKGDEYYE